MKKDYINENVNLGEIRAETILSLEDPPGFSVQTKENSGAFYRNYSFDLIKYDSDNTITLSRDSLYHLLPEGLFFEEDELKNSKDFKETSEKMKEKRRDISHFFQPFDTKYFNLSLALEKQMNKISEKGNEILLDLFFDKSAATVETGRAPSLQLLIPQISQIKGNEYLIINILKTILHIKKIELIELDYCTKRFIIHIPNLSKEEYNQKTEQISGIFEIFKEYFFPFNIDYDFKIKDREQKFILSNNLILDYNVNII